MIKTDSFLGNKKSSFNQNVWPDHASMQQDVLLHFWEICYIEIKLKYEKIILFIVYSYGKKCYLLALEVFQCLPPLFRCLPLWTTVRLHGKKLQNATKKDEISSKTICKLGSTVFWAAWGQKYLRKLKLKLDTIL